MNQSLAQERVSGGVLREVVEGGLSPLMNVKDLGRPRSLDHPRSLDQPRYSEQPGSLEQIKMLEEITLTRSVHGGL